MSTTYRRAIDMEVYGMILTLLDEGECDDIEAVRDRLHSEVDDAVEYYIGKQEEDEE